jgi:hypothetical protein
MNNEKILYPFRELLKLSNVDSARKMNNMSQHPHWTRVILVAYSYCTMTMKICLTVKEQSVGVKYMWDTTRDTTRE